MPYPKMYVEGFHDSEAVAKMKYNILGRTGLETSFLSFGASALGSVFRPTNEEDSIEVVKYAVKSGINYIDTAPWYGHGKAETILGKVLPELPRETYYLATKVGRYLPQAEQMFDFRAERAISSVDESLQRMGQEYVDIIQVHDMEFAPSLDVIINETLPALQKVKDSGKAKFIGITGYPLENFRTVIDRSQVQIDIVLTYCRGALNDSSLLDYIPYFQEKGVGIINASPHGMGLLSPRGSAAWHPAHSDIKQACREAAQYCEEKGVDISRISMDFALNLPGVHTTLFSTASLENLKKNLGLLSNPLSEVERTTLQEIMEKFMKPLNNKHWEGVEVSRYWDKIKGRTGEVVLG